MKRPRWGVEEVKVTSLDKRASKAGSKSRQTLLLVALVALGFVVGLSSTRLPVFIIFGLVGGLALFVLIYRNLEIGLYLFLILNMTVPQAGLSWDIGVQTPVGERGLHFNFHEIIIAMVLAAWIIQVLLKQADWRAKSPLVIPIILYVLTSILAGFVGMIHGGDVFILTYRFLRTVIFIYIFFLVINTIKTRQQYQVLVIIILITATLVAGFGVMQSDYVMGQAWSENFASSWLDKIGYPEEVNYVAGELGEVKAYRVNSTFLHPNVLGGYLVFALPFLVSMMFLTWRTRRYWLWLLLLIAMAVNGACLFLTGSRAAWIAAGCIALFYGVLGILDKRTTLVLVMAVLMILLVVFLFAPPDFVKKRMTSLHAQEAAQVRIYTYSMAVDLFMEHPVFGLGIGMEGEVIVQNNIREQWVAVENAFLTYLVSHGLIGLIAFLLIFFVFWAMLFYARSRSRGDPFIYFNSEALILGILGIFIANMFGAWLLFAIPMVTLFWFFLGMGGSLFNIFKEQEQSV
jgi:putative inorganic carbon (HCO3(-)) transporter